MLKMLCVVLWCQVYVRGTPSLRVEKCEETERESVTVEIQLNTGGLMNSRDLYSMPQK